MLPVHKDSKQHGILSLISYSENDRNCPKTEKTEYLQDDDRVFTRPIKC